MARRRYFVRARTYARRVYRRYVARRPDGLVGRFGGWISRAASKPSKPISAALTLGGLIYLIFAPLSDGDSWLGRILTGMQTAIETKNPAALLAQDSAGNNAISILGLQLTSNVWGALPMFAGAVVVRWLGRKFGF